MLNGSQHSLPQTRAHPSLPWEEDDMAYSDFTLQEVVQRLQLVIEEQHNLFGAVPEVVPGDFLYTLLLAKFSGYCSRWWAITQGHRCRLSDIAALPLQITLNSAASLTSFLGRGML
jgi:hypothetical protein